MLKMRIIFDSSSDRLYIQLEDATSSSIQSMYNMRLHLDSNMKPVGIEFLNASDNVPETLMEKIRSHTDHRNVPIEFLFSVFVDSSR